MGQGPAERVMYMAQVPASSLAQPRTSSGSAVVPVPQGAEPRLSSEWSLIAHFCPQDVLSTVEERGQLHGGRASTLAGLFWLAAATPYQGVLITKSKNATVGSSGC